MTTAIAELPEVPIQHRPWLTREDAAAIARVSRDTIDAAIRTRRLRERKGMSDRLGRIARTDLDAWIVGEDTT